MLISFCWMNCCHCLESPNSGACNQQCHHRSSLISVVQLDYWEKWSRSCSLWWGKPGGEFDFTSDCLSLRSCSFLGFSTLINRTHCELNWFELLVFGPLKWVPVHLKLGLTSIPQTVTSQLGSTLSSFVEIKGSHNQCSCTLRIGVPTSTAIVENLRQRRKPS